MAHECFACGGECYCSGDIDDCIVSLTPARCESCGCEEERLDLLYGDDEEDEDQPWLCSCGHYETSGLHCSRCGNQPPWGCDCSGCNEPDGDELEEWEYPHY